jgi:hypothetical protein
LHLGRSKYAMHLTYTRLLTGEEGAHSDFDWLNLSVERRF